MFWAIIVFVVAPLPLRLGLGGSCVQVAWGGGVVPSVVNLYNSATVLCSTIILILIPSTKVHQFLAHFVRGIYVAQVLRQSLREKIE